MWTSTEEILTGRSRFGDARWVQGNVEQAQPSKELISKPEAFACGIVLGVMATLMIGVFMGKNNVKA